MSLLRGVRLNLLKRLKNSFRKMSISTSADDVLFEKKGDAGLITLNRPKALNSLNESMVVKLHKQLKEWEDECSFVVIKGSGEKSFCAGGDVVAATRVNSDGSRPGKSFFRNEYKTNFLIGVYRIPYIALLNGITMGGGVGLSVHAPYRIATEKTLFAMPETAIGLFPDVGGSHFLPRLEGKLGLYLGLSGHRLQGADVVRVGVATHYIESKYLPQFMDKLFKTKVEGLEEFLRKNTVDVKNEPFILYPYLDQIDKCFSGSTIEEIVERLKQDDSLWANRTLDTLSNMSPTSLKITIKELQLGSSLNLRECLKMEYRLASSAVEEKISSDFFEGVRALLVDKDKNPKWKPSNLSDITDELIEKCFLPLSPEEELDI